MSNWGAGVRESKIPFGERDGILHRAYEVDNGLRVDVFAQAVSDR